MQKTLTEAEVEKIEEPCSTCEGTGIVVENAGCCGGCEHCGSREEREVSCPDCTSDPWEDRDEE